MPKFAKKNNVEDEVHKLIDQYYKQKDMSEHTFVTRIRDIYYLYFVYLFKEYNKFFEPVEKDKEKDDIREYFKKDEFCSKQK